MRPGGLRSLCCSGRARSGRRWPRDGRASVAQRDRWGARRMHDDRMLSIDSLSCYRWSFCGRLQLRPIQHRRFAGDIETFDSSASAGARFSNFDRTNFASACDRNASDRHTVVDDRVVVPDDVIVDDRSVPINVADSAARNAIQMRMVIVEMADLDEREQVDAEVKIKTDADAHAVEMEAVPGHPMRTQRQWRPAAIHIRVTPGYPRRRPSKIGDPYPAATRVQMPTPVVKRRPAPTVVGVPIPAAVGVNPSATVPVRPPGAVDDDDARLPTPAHAFHFHPCSVRRE